MFTYTNDQDNEPVTLQNLEAKIDEIIDSLAKLTKTQYDEVCDSMDKAIAINFYRPRLNRECATQWTRQ